jgi:hypothetical protein
MIGISIQKTGFARRVVVKMGAQEADRAKAHSRVGQGRGQGPYRGHAGAEVIARAAGGPIEQLGRPRGEAPVKPQSIALQEEQE